MTDDTDPLMAGSSQSLLVVAGQPRPSNTRTACWSWKGQHYGSDQQERISPTESPTRNSPSC